MQGLGQFVTPSMYFYVPDPTELARERRAYEESFLLMHDKLSQLAAKVNGSINTEVGSSNFPQSKRACGAKMDDQSPTVEGSKKVDFF